MTIQEIFNAVKDGSLTVKKNGHLINPIKETLADYFEMCNDLLADASAEDNERMQAYFSKHIENPLKRSNRIGDIETYCFDCGATLHLYLVNGKIELVDQFKYRNYRVALQDSDGIDRFSPLPTLPKELRICPAASLRKMQCMKTSINIPSGDLLIQNFILDDNISDPKSKNGTNYSINSLDGRNNIMQYYGGLDIGYGQMGNMYMDVLVNADGTEVLFASDCGFDEDGEEIFYSFPGFTKIGTISNNMWRWMCADKKVLDELGYDYTQYTDSQVWVKIQPGKWCIEHYYDVVDDHIDGVYSRLKYTK